MSFIKELATLSLSGAALGLLVYILRRILGRRLPSAFYYYAWVLVLLRMVLPLPGLLGLPASQEPEPAAYVTVQTGGELRASRQIDPPAFAGMAGPQVVSEEPVQYSAPAQEEAAEPSPAQDPGLGDYVLALGAAALGLISRLDWGLVLPCLWAIGALGLFAWYLGSYLRFIHALRPSLSPAGDYERRELDKLGGRGLELYTSSLVSGPMLMGLRRPMLVLPQRIWDPASLRDIFLHELTHHRRRDLWVKWWAVLVACLHWFDPAAQLVLRALDRDQELSCDEKILRDMEPSRRRSYARTLLSLAEDQAGFARPLATSFSTERENLKERLCQIMRYKKPGLSGLILALAAAVLLCGCSAALGPQSDAPAADAPPAASFAPVTPTPSPTPQVELRQVTVSTVDQLLAAIAPYTAITLEPGDYDLTQASDYGLSQTDSKYYRWDTVYDGYELVLSGLEGLQFLGSGAEEARILTQPRYADVLSFESCRELFISGLTLGHSPDQGECVGGVLHMAAVDSVIVSQCGLFGCGTMGLTAADCTQIRLLESQIYHCSYGALDLTNCRDVLMNGCQVYENEGFALFTVRNCQSVGLINSTIRGNNNRALLQTASSSELLFGGNAVEDSRQYSEGLFYIEGDGPVVTGCSFEGFNGRIYASQFTQSDVAVDKDGKAIESIEALSRMALEPVESWSATAIEQPEVQAGEDGFVEVSTADEFLAAIAPGSKIRITGQIDLSTASDYGGYGSSYYIWRDTRVDGPQLTIQNVKDLTIQGLGTDRSAILAVPRYAEVLAFESCPGLSLSGLTLGHTQDPGGCIGGVLYLYDCSEVRVKDCSLFGCGIWGITASNCWDVEVESTEIYECSRGDLNLTDCHDMSFNDCNFHHNGGFRYISNCTNMTMDGGPIPSLSLDLEALGAVLDEDLLSAGDDPLRVGLDFFPLISINLPQGQPLTFEATVPGQNQILESPASVTWSLTGQGSDQVELYEWSSNRVTLTNQGLTGGSLSLTAELDGESYTVTIYPSP